MRKERGTASARSSMVELIKVRCPKTVSMLTGARRMFNLGRVARSNGYFNSQGISKSLCKTQSQLVHVNGLLEVFPMR